MWRVEAEPAVWVRRNPSRQLESELRGDLIVRRGSPADLEQGIEQGPAAGK
jgi:hypothetical protein